MFPLSRRQALQRVGLGFGSIALSTLLAELGYTANDASNPASDAESAGLSGSSLAPKPPQFAPRAKRIIHVFANGGPSQIDTFDPKPELKKYHGKLLASELKGDKRVGGAGFASPFKFAKHGKSGLDVSELFPNIARHVDDMCVIRSMVTDIPNHEQAFMMMNCGDFGQPKPSVGSWVLYGLGTENQSLPGFVVMCPAGMPTVQGSNWRSAFLPGVYQGTYIDSQETSPDHLVANIHNELLVPGQQRRQLDYIQQLNELHRHNREDDAKLDARIASLELAFRMQREAGEAFDVTLEPQNIRDLYGDTLQGRQMLIARRLAERGVRYVQVYHGAGQPWDSHAKLEESHRRLAGDCDQAIAALLTDLKQRGLLDDTLVIWGGEMGRTPTMQLPVTAKVGRDHHHQGFTVWLAGGGVRGGYAHGKTTELGLDVAEDPVHVHDLHATILHLLGFDHEKLTFRYAGRDFRLTDVHGRVVKELLA
ncbi:MAG TPA: DUF1501 domain-containing protein [Pirellulales bacterium]|jgi:hypothetical protein|nr:DUF1501 domain-containing protein [Pirellulales bacterium]